MLSGTMMHVPPECFERAPAAALRLRPATARDAAFLIGLRNEPAVRAASRHTEEVDQEEHHRWLKRTLRSPAHHLLIVLDAGDEPCGQVRFDASAPGAWEISIALAPDLRSRGLGTRAISSGVEWLRRRDPAATVVAAVRPDNVGSIKAFTRTGFLPDNVDVDGLTRLVSRPGG